MEEKGSRAWDGEIISSHYMHKELLPYICPSK